MSQKVSSSIRILFSRSTRIAASIDGGGAREEDPAFLLRDVLPLDPEVHEARGSIPGLPLLEVGEGVEDLEAGVLLRSVPAAVGVGDVARPRQAKKKMHFRSGRFATRAG